MNGGVWNHRHTRITAVSCEMIAISGSGVVTAASGWAATVEVGLG